MASSSRANILLGIAATLTVYATRLRASDYTLPEVRPSVAMTLQLPYEERFHELEERFRILGEQSKLQDL